MQIKTIVHDTPEVFDSMVNGLLANGWCLVKRGTTQHTFDSYALYAELVLYDDPDNPIDGNIASCVRNAKCEQSTHSEAEQGQRPDFSHYSPGDAYNAMLMIHRICTKQDYCPSCPLFSICGSDFPDRWNVNN